MGGGAVSDGTADAAATCGRARGARPSPAPRSALHALLPPLPSLLFFSDKILPQNGSFLMEGSHNSARRDSPPAVAHLEWALSRLAQVRIKISSMIQLISWLNSGACDNRGLNERSGFLLSYSMIISASTLWCWIED